MGESAILGKLKQFIVALAVTLCNFLSALSSLHKLHSCSCDYVHIDLTLVPWYDSNGWGCYRFFWYVFLADKLVCVLANPLTGKRVFKGVQTKTWKCQKTFKQHIVPKLYGN